MLIGEFGETVVIDWGLAKDLGAAETPDAADALGAGAKPAAAGETVAGSVMGTPSYMAPEQAQGQELDERADVYAVGAILYHLLAGRAPYGGTTTNEVLDDATSQCGLGDVLERQGKLKASVTATISCATIREKLVEGDRTNRGMEGYLATTEHFVAQRLLLTGDLSGALAWARKALAVREKFARPDEYGSRFWLASANAMVGDVLMALGDPAGALPHYRTELAVMSDVTTRDPKPVLWHTELAYAHANIGDALLSQRDAPGALAEYRQYLQIAEGLGPTKRNEAHAHLKLGDALLAGVDAKAALAEYEQSAAIWQELVAKSPTHVPWRIGSAQAREKTGEALLRLDPPGAFAEIRAALAILEELAATRPDDVTSQRELARGHETLGRALVATGKRDDARKAYRAALGIHERLVANDPSNERARNDAAAIKGLDVWK